MVGHAVTHREVVGSNPAPGALPILSVKEKKMHTTIVKMKDGREFRGALWTFRPLEGWFNVTEEGSPEKIYFKDCESVITLGQRIHPGVTENQDEIERAKENLPQLVRDEQYNKGVTDPKILEERIKEIIKELY